VLGSETARARWLLLAPTALLYALTFFVPLALLLVFSVATWDRGVIRLGFSLANYRDFFADGVTLGIFGRTVRLAIFITGACLVLGYPVAAFMRRCGGRMRLVLIVLVISPLLTSVIVRNVAWLLILGRTGLVNKSLQAMGVIDAPLKLMYNELGVVIAVVHVYLSFMVLPIFGALISIEPSLEESAASLGARPWQVFWNVTLPLSMPGVAAGCTLVFVLSMGVYLTPVIMGGNFVVTLPMVISEVVRNQFNWAVGSALAVVLLLFVSVLLSASARLQRTGRES
jgi:putative spermidine/putrescine transport system permease protein